MPRAVLVFLAFAIAALGVIALRPDLDLRVAGWFFDQSGFAGASRATRTARSIFYALPILTLTSFLFAYGASKLGASTLRPFAPSGRSVLLLVLSLALGPGLLVNVALKDHWGRPRPVQTREFGGDLPFSPFWRPGGGCAKNCSFVSGEASAGFWLAVPASLAPPPLRAAAIIGAVLIGAATGVLRMSFGGHYLSDVIGAGLVTLLAAEAVALGLRLASRRRAPPGGVASSEAVPLDRTLPGSSALPLSPDGSRP